MKIPLYSDAHLEAAKELYPDRVCDQEWLSTQWTDEEINACKTLESETWTNNPTLSNLPYPIPKADRAEYSDHVAGMVDEFCQENEINTVLSVGCGGGEKEFWLAMRHPNVHFTAIDNAPYTEQLNIIADELKLNNIRFICHDLRDAHMGKFDVVFSHAVIYCIPDNYISDYFAVLENHLAKGGRMIVGSASNISLMFKIIRVIKGDNIVQGYKKTGWLRDLSQVKKHIPSDVSLIKVSNFKHGDQIPGFIAPGLRRVVEWFGRSVFPVSNSSYGMLFIRKKKIN